MINSKKITIAIPTFNRAIYLRKCIQSVISYQGDDIEIIISDNASPDNTKEIVSEFNDKRIIYTRNPTNIGSLDNFYKLIEDSSGEYIFFLTDDDYLLPGAIEEIKAFINKSNVNAFKCDLIVYNEKSKTAFNYKFFENNIVLYCNDYKKQALIWQSSHIYTGCCFRKSAIPISLKDSCFTWYPSMLLFGVMNQSLGYLSAPIAIHTWENELFWNIDDGEKENILIESKINILDFLQKSNKPRIYIEKLAYIIFQDASKSKEYKLEKYPKQLLEFLCKKDLRKIRRDRYFFQFKKSVKKTIRFFCIVKKYFS